MMMLMMNDVDSEAFNSFVMQINRNLFFISF